MTSEVNHNVITMDMFIPCSYCHKNIVYFYSLASVGNRWHTRIESSEINLQKVTVKQGPIKIIGINYDTSEFNEIECNLVEPYISKITEYDESNNDYLVQTL